MLTSLENILTFQRNEKWKVGKIGVKSTSVLHPNSCYNELCYIEVQVYFATYIGIKFHVDEIPVFLILFAIEVANIYTPQASVYLQ